jgi:hypothetical protein
MLDVLSPTFGLIPDPRQADRVGYSLHDTLMRGVALLFFQHASLLACQRTMKQRRGCCHLETIFGGHEVPSDTQRREIVAGVPGEGLRPLLPALFAKVRRAGGAPECKRTVPRGTHHGDSSTAMLDGSDYFHSTNMECPGCLPRSEAHGAVHFRHPVVSATLVKAGSPRVLPLEVEAVRNSDGQDKQDCEVNAATRRLPRLRQEPPQLPLIIGGDARSCHEPFSAQWRALGLPQVLGCKPTSHRDLYAWVEDLERLAGGDKGQWHAGPACRRRFDTSRMARSVPLTAARWLWGTFVEVWEQDRTGQQLSHKAWCTDVEVTPDHVAAVVGLGRSRWQSENEQCNVHKNHGDELEHHSGHGKQTLSMVFSLLNLLAFIAPVILERGDPLSQRCLATTSRRELWHTLRTALRRILVTAWADFLLIYLDEAGPSP